MTTINSFDDRTQGVILQMVRDYLAGKLGGSSGARRQTDETSKEIYFTNDSGEEIPAYACMKITGTEEIDGQNYLVVDKPDAVWGAASSYLFNGPYAVADKEEGMAQSTAIIRALKDTSETFAEVGFGWGPTKDEWHLTPGGYWHYLGEDDIDDDVIRVVLGSDSFVVKTPGGGINARSTATLGKASCAVAEYYHDAGVKKIRDKSGVTVDVYNMVPTAITASAWIQVKWINGLATVDVDAC